MPQRVEFWPDYGRGPLWGDRGIGLDPVSLGLPAELTSRLLAWNREYSEDKLPLEKPSVDPGWLATGRLLLQEVRDALGDGFDVVVTEPWWGEQPIE